MVDETKQTRGSPPQRRLGTSQRFYDIDERLRQAGYKLEFPTYPKSVSIPPQFNFSYKPLQTGKSIRLLQLDPAETEDAPLYARFIDTGESDNPTAYEAISYTWGEPIFNARLRIGDGTACPLEELGITANLASALRRFRLRDSVRVLWADAVCINQSDIQEKQTQVGMMAGIYKNAAQVLIWLGPGTDDVTHRAMDGFRDLARWLINRGLGSVPDDKSDLAMALLFNKKFLTIPTDSSVAKIQDEILENGIGKIYTNPYFSRMWIVQEIALASRAVIYQGQCELEWTTFAIAMMGLKVFVDNRSNIFVYDEKMLRRAAEIVEVQLMFTLCSGPPRLDGKPLDAFGASMRKLRGQTCADDRDRIYALLSLQTGDRTVHMKPDYSLALNDIFLDFARKALESGRLEVLYDAGTWDRQFSPSQLRAEQGFLPSWVPDYRNPSPARQLSWLTRYVEAKNYELLESEQTKIGGKGFILEIEAFCLLRISDCVSREFPDPRIHIGGQPGCFEATREHVLACRDMFKRVSQSNDYPLGGDAETAFWSTLVTKSPCLTSQTITGFGGMVYSAEGLRYASEMFKAHCLDENGEVFKDRFNVMVNRSWAINKASFDVATAILFYETVRDTIADIPFFVSDDGLVGLAAPGTKVGDIVVCVKGSAIPLVLRPSLVRGLYSLVGSCYLAGYCPFFIERYQTYSLF